MSKDRSGERPVTPESVFRFEPIAGNYYNLEQFMDHLSNLNNQLESKATPFREATKGTKKKARGMLSLLGLDPVVYLNPDDNKIKVLIAKTNRFIKLPELGSSFFAAKKPKIFQKVDFRNPFHVVTGTCMSSAWGIIARTPEREIPLLDPSSYPLSQPIQEINFIDPKKLTPYESTTITGFLSIIQIMQLLGYAGNIHGISIHIPGPEYTLYFLEAYRNKLITREQYEQIIQWISDKYENLRSNWVKVARFLLPESVQVTITSPLQIGDSPISEELKDILLNSQSPRDEIIQAIKKNSPFSEEWTLLLSHCNPNLDFSDLTYLSYIAAYINLMKKWPLVAVENAEEFPIFLNTAKMLSENAFFNPQAIGIYHPYNLEIGVNDEITYKFRKKLPEEWYITQNSN